jgi:hypothetical protein
MIGDVQPDVVVHDLGHQAVDGAPRTAATRLHGVVLLEGR